MKETQAGFRPGYSTVDHLFTLESLIQIAFKRQTKLFCFFVDYKAAYDSVNWQALFYKLFKYGFSANFIRLLENT